MTETRTALVDEYATRRMRMGDWGEDEEAMTKRAALCPLPRLRPDVDG